MSLWTGIFIAIILVLLLCAIIFLTVFCKERKVSLPLSIVGLSLAAFTLACASYFTGSGIILLHTNGDPSASVDSFYSQVIAGNYPESYKHLKDYTTLGLENIPQDDYSEKIYSALRESYSYELVGQASIDQFTAEQTVRFTYLEIGEISNDIASRIDGLLEEKIEELSFHEIYDDNGDYRTVLLDEVYDTAFNEAMKNAAAYTVTTEYVVSLEYVGDTWLILVNDEMTYCFAGGTK